MKRREFLLGAIVLGLLCLGSCSDNDDGLDMNKSITVYGRPYELTEVIAWQSNPYMIRTTVPYIFEDTYQNEDGETRTDKVVGFSPGEDSKEYGNFMLSFYEQGMVYNEELARISGKGVNLCCHLVSPEKDRLVPGKYSFNKERVANTFIAYFSSEYDPEGVVTPSIISEGEVTIEEKGDEYKVVFRCSNVYGSEVSGIYEGVIRQVRVNQLATASYNDVMLSGLMKHVVVNMVIPGVVEMTEETPDVGFGNQAFLSTSTGESREADSNKEGVDVALIWDRDNDYFRFESPIRMRTMLGHEDKYNFPCHTIYSLAPDSFTDEDFDNLDKTGFTFDLKDEGEVIFKTQPFTKGFVFFKTGLGVRGVIRIKDFIPMGSKTEILTGIIMTSEIGPKLLIDVKSESSFPNPVMR